MDLKRCEDRTLRRTATTKVAIDYGCSTGCSRNVPSRSCRRQKQSRDGKCDVREHEHRFDKTLDEDGVILLVGTTASAEPLPLEFTHPEEVRAGQDYVVRLLPSTSGYSRW